MTRGTGRAHPLHLCGLAAACAVLAACNSAPPRAATPRADPAPPEISADKSFDWHGLILMPFGTLLKDTPVPLHEVLLFHEGAHDAAEPEVKDCFAVDVPPPRLVDRETDEYLLCFDHDHLTRIQASVHLDAGEAAEVFAKACASWSKNAAPSDAEACEGRDGTVVFNARLTVLSEEPAILTLVLLDAADRDAARDAAP